MPDKVLAAIRIVAIDAAFTHTGVVGFEYQPPGWRPILADCIVTEKETEKHRSYETDDKYRRVRLIFTALREAVANIHPQLIAAELPVSGGKSASAHASMGIAIAIIACLEVSSGVPVRAYNWDQVKLVLTSDRNASKAQVQNAVAAKYPELTKRYRSSRSALGYTGEFEHVADAVGVAHCAINSDVIQALIKQYEATNG